MIDLNSRSRLSDRINRHIDDGMAAEADAPRDYLGCSQLGDGCELADYFAFAAGRTASRDAGDAPLPAFPPRIRRIFQCGRDVEELAARWLRQARFLLSTADPLTGGQYEVSFFGGAVRGHADGLLVMWRGDGPSPLPLPALWECKRLGAKWWREAQRKGIRVSHPKYFVQMQLYMKGLGLERGLITCVNADTCELHHELVPFAPEAAERALERARRILLAFDSGERPPRAEKSPAAVACRMCRFADPCWGTGGEAT